MTTQDQSSEGAYYTDKDIAQLFGISIGRLRNKLTAGSPLPPRQAVQAGSPRPSLVSIVAMNWAWGRQLKPTAKLVLMSLADAADDQGVCWPSIPTLARKCCTSTRTVQRILGELVETGLLRAEPRFR